MLVAVLVSGSSVDLSAQRPASALSSNVSVQTAAEFRRSDVQSRQRLMRAWAHGSPDAAGPALLPLIEGGLQDADKNVRHYAIGVLQRVASEAKQARATSKPVTTDPGAYPALYPTLLRLLDHPDTTLRAGIVAALPAFATAPTDALDDVLVRRLASEVPYVRARIVTALAERATEGSAEARAAVLSTLDDPHLGVRVSAVKAMRSLRAPEALPVLLREMESAEAPEVRKMVVQVLASYGDAAHSYLSAVAARRTREANPAVKAELDRLIGRLERSASAPR